VTIHRLNRAEYANTIRDLLAMDLRAIRGPDGTKPDTEFALTDLELASRLSLYCQFLESVTVIDDAVLFHLPQR
jgi:hypothetical protein